MRVLPDCELPTNSGRSPLSLCGLSYGVGLTQSIICVFDTRIERRKCSHDLSVLWATCCMCQLKQVSGKKVSVGKWICKKRPDSREKILMLGKTEGKRRRGQQRMRWIDSITDSMDMSLSKHQETMKDREVWHAAIHRVTKSQKWLATEQQQWFLFLTFFSFLAMPWGMRDLISPTRSWTCDLCSGSTES